MEEWGFELEPPRWSLCVYCYLARIGSDLERALSPSSNVRLRADGRWGVDMNFVDLSIEQQIASLLDPARQVLAEYGMATTTLENINHEYNSTFSVTTDDGAKYALRMNINSGRTESNIAAELFFVGFLAGTGKFSVAEPVTNRSGSYVTKVHHRETDRELLCVLFSWLEGDDVGDEPELDDVFKIGSLMAQLHQATEGLTLPQGSDLPVLDDFMWHVEDFLLGPKSRLTPGERRLILRAKQAIEGIVAKLYASSEKQLIHADLHGWNLKLHEGSLSVFDFDDSGIGLPIQDLATTIYYLDTEEQEISLKRGYESVRPLPSFSDREMKGLLLQRRIHLLNYIYETQNPEHRELLPKYQSETMRRIELFLAD
jgi:Ser/Thr protein kinase RdoA (MazF antagonist)